MIDLNKEEYVYLMIVLILGVDKTTINYNVTPFKNINDAKNAVIDDITNNIKNDRDNISHVSYIDHDCTEECDYGHITSAIIEFKSGVNTIYRIVSRIIK